MRQCRACGAPKHPGMTCAQAAIIPIKPEPSVISHEQALSHADEPSVISHGYARVARWRKAHPMVHRERHAAYMRARRNKKVPTGQGGGGPVQN